MRAKFDELLRTVDKAREQFIGIEELTDHQTELVRAVLERYAREQRGKQRTPEDTVDCLLDRMSGTH